MTLSEIKAKARGQMGNCKSCDICDGRACSNLLPGPGAKGSGLGATKNFEAWKKYELNIDTISDDVGIDTSFEIFGKKFVIPVFAAPIGNIRLHYSKLFKEDIFYKIIVRLCKDAGVCAWTGDGIDEEIVKIAATEIKENSGICIPTLKPFDIESVKKKLEIVKESSAFAFAMDIDSVGIKSFRTDEWKVKSYSTNDLIEIKKCINIPFIIKGIMTVNGAKKAIEAGADAIVVSNHGGRVLDEVPATADVLKEISDYAKGKCKIFVDGGIRTGRDVFKALALGADAVLIGRPFVQVVFGDPEDGVNVYVKSLKEDLEDAMLMCGAKKLSDINSSMIRV